MDSVICLNLGKNGWIGVDELPAFERPVDQHRLANDIAPGHKPPDTRVVARGPIISHYKILPWPHFPGIRCRIQRNIRIGWSTDIWLLQFNTVDPDIFAIHGNNIPRYSDYSLDEVFTGIEGKVKDDYVSPFWIVKQVGCFVHQHVFVAVEAWLHTDIFDSIALDGEANNKEYEEC